MHPRLTVSQASTLRWPLERDLELYAARGIRRVGLLLRKLEAVGLARATALVAAAEIEVDNVMVGPVLELARPAQWPEGRERLRAVVDLTRELGADCAVITTGPAGPLAWEEAAEALADALAPALAQAASRGVAIAVEHTNGLRFDLGFLHNLRDTLDLARRIGFLVCMEVNNAWGERGLGETIAHGARHLRIVQVNDFVVGTLSTPDRAVPGDGDIPLERILAQLVAAGYRGPFELEIVGPRIEAEGYESAVARSLDHLERLLARVGA